MLAVELLALGPISLTGMSLPRHLLLKMSMKHKYNLPLKEEFQLYQLSWEQRNSPSPAVFDIIHCAQCRVPCHIEGGKLLLESNRMLQPGGYLVHSATPVYQKLPEDVEIWEGRSPCRHACAQYL